MTILALAALLAAPAGTGVTRADSVTERARRDEIVTAPNNDPEMAEAFRKARAQLPDFLKLARAPGPGMSHFALKVKITDGRRDEYFWIAPFAEAENGFAGRVNNKPRLVHTVKEGQRITFAVGDIYDWLFVDRGQMKGNFTACVLLRREPPAEADELRKQIGLTCEPEPLQGLGR
jgi:uncharacterized protein YegJ (DUF2314 family)